jgi:hypothetical protein
MLNKYAQPLGELRRLHEPNGPHARNVFIEVVVTKHLDARQGPLEVVICPVQ